ncbi:hypothetical protein DUZ99_06645 [Xylanibacillus composti]|uniref:Uncharacterized protein n=1 Tax=Xylanibacillus composti TaxID=1572762 RepID=A0A8J4M4B8_9BACL|nr:hypothetical protein [Xylanibacillus composti]MDT9724670.1 hypothetical protein [Xylanibacillus composti]GIQ70955.1 hypothetical protein XYCOK13_37790 [Xylanibacillus composti]
MAEYGDGMRLSMPTFIIRPSLLRTKGEEFTGLHGGRQEGEAGCGRIRLFLIPQRKARRAGKLALYMVFAYNNL